MWPFKKNNNVFESWPIFRLTKTGKIYGRSITIFINNSQCHLTSIDVYSDGAIDCWGFVDLKLFSNKVRGKWVVACPRKGQNIYVFNFGITGALNIRFKLIDEDIISIVNNTVKELNPKMDGLIDMQGSDVELRDNVKYAKMGIADKKLFIVNPVTGDEIVGDSVPIIKIENERAYLTNLFVFANGNIKIGLNGLLQDVSALSGLYRDGILTNHANPNTWIDIPGLGSFLTENKFGGLDVNNRIAEVYDMIDLLNGKPGVIKLCRNAFDDFTKEPSEENKNKLKISYECLPDHLRRFCGDMDVKDHDIIKAIGLKL